MASVFVLRRSDGKYKGRKHNYAWKRVKWVDSLDQAHYWQTIIPAKAYRTLMLREQATPCAQFVYNETTGVWGRGEVLPEQFTYQIIEYRLQIVQTGDM